MRTRLFLRRSQAPDRVQPARCVRVLVLSTLLVACAPQPLESAAMTEPAPSVEHAPSAVSERTPAEDHGRRLLTRALVLTGPDRRMTVQLTSGRTLLLQGVTLNPADYCGTALAEQAQPLGTCMALRSRYCGSYGAIASAEPGDSGWTFDGAGRCTGGPNLQPR